MRGLRQAAFRRLTLCSPTGPATPIAIADSRLVAFDGECVIFKGKDYRAERGARYKLTTLDADEVIRRFLIHVLPDGFHRIRHYGLLADPADDIGERSLAMEWPPVGLDFRDLEMALN